MAVNGLYVVQGEVNAVVALLKKAHRHWPHHQQQVHLGHSLVDETDPLLRNFSDLRDVFNSVNDLSDMNPDTYLSPFLDVIRSDQTNGPVTAQALSSVSKFLSYGLIDSSSIKASNAVENIADAVTNAKFIGSADSGRDEVVLLRILQVLRTLLLTPVGRLLSNESVCEMMQSCFRISFEPALTELLREVAEATLSDMTQLLFTRLPSFQEDIRHPYIRKLVKRAGHIMGKRRRQKNYSNDSSNEKGAGSNLKKNFIESQSKPKGNMSMILKETSQGADTSEQLSSNAELSNNKETMFLKRDDKETLKFENLQTVDDVTIHLNSTDQHEVPFDCSVSSAVADEEHDREFERMRHDLDDGMMPDNDDSSVSSVEENVEKGRIVRKKFKSSGEVGDSVSDLEKENSSMKGNDELKRSPEPLVSNPAIHIPYGIPCIRELLRFLIALINPTDRANTESMILMSLNLLTVALEAGADHIRKFSLLMPLVKDELCRALLQLLDIEKLPVFAATNRVCFMLFEGLRLDLKFQFEAYFLKLKSIVTSEQTRISYEQKEMALESIVQLWRVAGVVTELYFNYDCDLYCSNLFEDLTKLLLENAFPVLGLRSINLLSLDGLLTIVDTIDNNCIYRQAGGAHFKTSALPSSLTQLHLPVVSGYVFGRQIALYENDRNVGKTGVFETFSPSTALHANRMASSCLLPSMAEVIERKNKKRVMTEATELFNQDPRKGIEFLKEKAILKSPLEACDVVNWLKGNPRLDKKRIAEYICSRKNTAVLHAFVRSFPFKNIRLDDALRMFLETFRLPGEAGEISMVMQHFAEHWYVSNGEPFNHVDAAFTLAYAIIMLNTDQHNPQVRRNQQPMRAECFIRNLSGTNGGQDFDSKMLDEIYRAIRDKEIVMPAEQVGIVKENYLWKVLLRRGETKEGEFIHVPAGWNDHDLFSIIWGPASAALSFVFDKSGRESILQKVLSGYRKCASIAAHYGMSDVFDNLIIHLCKFSTLMSTSESNSEQNLQIQQHRSVYENSQNAELIAISFGENTKAQMAAKAMFQLVHAHGDILREGWKNVLDCILRLFYARLLPSVITEVEDFVDKKGWVSIQRAPPPKFSTSRNDSSLLSWLGLGSNYDNKEFSPNPDQLQLIKVAQGVIVDCHPEQLIVDGKYLTSSALAELISAIIQASTNIAHMEADKIGPTSKKLKEQEEDALVLYLEMMISIALENKDRLSQIWSPIKQHLQWLLSTFGRNPLIMERAVVGLLRIANRNLFRIKDDVTDEVLQSLGILLKLPAPAMFMFSRQITYGLHELLRTNAANVHLKEHWAVLFGLMEAAGAGAYPEDFPMHHPVMQQSSSPSKSKAVDREAYSDTEPCLSRLRIDDAKERVSLDRGYTSDVIKGSLSSLSSFSEHHMDSTLSLTKEASTEWIHINHKDAALCQQQMKLLKTGKHSSVFDRGTVVLRINLMRHDPFAFLKLGETLAFLVRDAAHITPENFDSCVECLRSYTEAGLDGGRYASGPLSSDAQSQLRSVVRNEKSKHKNHKQMSINAKNDFEKEEKMSQAEPQQLSACYQQITYQVLDLCHTLHVKSATIYKSWADSGAKIDASLPTLWCHCWRPLLQCMARNCCDCRRQVRTQAINFLVRAFLIPEMQAMQGEQWEDCFAEVLFPLLQKLLENLSPMDPIGMEETRVRAMQLVSKILLNHLTPLSSMRSFSCLWLHLLDYMDQYLHADRSDLLSEAIPESLKNMILVMDNTEMFNNIPDLYEMTVKRIGVFLPELLAEVMPGPPRRPEQIDQNSENALKSVLPSKNIEGDKFSFNAAASILPQQMNINRKVLIAPPIDLTQSSHFSSIEQIKLDDVEPSSQTDCTTNLFEFTKQCSAPELEEVIIHPSGSSPPIQSHFVEPALMCQENVPLLNAGANFCQQNKTRQEYASTLQMYGNNNFSNEKMMHLSDEVHFANSTQDTCRMAPPHLLLAQQQLEQHPFHGLQVKLAQQSSCLPMPMGMTKVGPLVPSPNSAFSPPISSTLRTVAEVSLPPLNESSMKELQTKQ